LHGVWKLISISFAPCCCTQTGGPSFDVPTGRRDGKVSNLRDGDALPDVHDSAQVLRSKFAASGLDSKDLALLSCEPNTTYYQTSLRATMVVGNLSSAN
jgi:hypothetical protein